MHTAWKLVMDRRIAPLFVAIWPGTAQATTSVTYVDSLDTPSYNVEVCNTHSNPLQHLIVFFPTSNNPLRLPNSSSLEYLEGSEGVMLRFVKGVTSLSLRRHMHTYFSLFNSIINYDSYNSFLYC